MNPKEEKREIRRMATEIYCADFNNPGTLAWKSRSAYILACELFAMFSKYEAERYPDKKR